MGMSDNSEVDDIIARLKLDADDFKQTEALELVRNPFGGVWTTVYQIGEDPYSAPAIYACLADPSLEEEILGDVDWIRRPENFTPGFYVMGDKTIYDCGRDGGYDYIVKEVEFFSLETSQVHVSQELTFLFGLFLDDDGCWYAVDECGHKDKVVDVGAGFVRFRTKYLLRYIAAKQMLYVQFVDSHRSSSVNYPISPVPIEEEDEREDSCHYRIWFQSTPKRDYLFSMLYARSVVRPDDVATCGIWPYDEVREEAYPEFIIKELPDGTYERFTCDPERLGNYFGANPDAPHYLTPVYFDPAVLDKYRGDPHFDVSERKISCGSEWALEIDNAIPSRVMVYLGDLGRVLPAGERGHFLEYEISPEGQRISETAIAQDFLGSFDAPMGPITALLSARRELDEAWVSRFGQPLFRSLHEDDLDMGKLIYIPGGDGRSNFDTVTLNLTKLCIDYIDESVLPKERSGGINRLEDFLKAKSIACDLKPLRDLQNIRSSSTAHAKGSGYEKVKTAGLVTGDPAADISRLVERLAKMMNDLASELCENEEQP